MKRRKVLPVLCTGAVLVLGLSACTGNPQDPAPPTEAVELLMATHSEPTYRALGAIYADQLEQKGYQVTLLDPVADPAAQVLAGQADLVITSAGTAAHQVAPARPDTKNTDSAVLSREQSAKMIVGALPENVRALDASPGDLGSVLVMSRAQLALQDVEDYKELAQKCPSLKLAAPQASATLLREGLDGANCSAAKVEATTADRLPGMLRNAEVDGVVLSQADALIADEGFVAVAGTEALFDSEPVLVLGDADVDEGAARAINEVTAKLDEDTLTAVSRMTHGTEPASAEDVAERWQWLSQ
ncbi:glycine betaine ABC transporter substrate-binding protein [Glutamicibacter creatinolyticus]|uniref:glycine betaine ABC transporter substrate-binding protein n=1 Tax=Glutamicibacter creatinolyticus TaxID=162496 RepID=UPI003217B130